MNFGARHKKAATMNEKTTDYKIILEELSNAGVLSSFDCGLAVWSVPGKKWFCKFTIKYKEFSVSSEWIYAETVDEAINLGAIEARKRYFDLLKL